MIIILIIIFANYFIKVKYQNQIMNQYYSAKVIKSYFSINYHFELNYLIKYLLKNFVEYSFVSFKNHYLLNYQNNPIN